MKESSDNHLHCRRHPRVLLAEDDDELRKLVTQTLRAQDFTVIECTNGLVLVEMIVSAREAGSPIDLVVSDVRMPGVSGLSVLEALFDWDEFPSPPVVLITAFGNTRLHALAKQFGARCVLEKPFEMTALLHVARGAIDEGHPLPPSFP